MIYTFSVTGWQEFTIQVSSATFGDCFCVSTLMYKDKYLLDLDCFEMLPSRAVNIYIILILYK